MRCKMLCFVLVTATTACGCSSESNGSQPATTTDAGGDGSAGSAGSTGSTTTCSKGPADTQTDSAHCGACEHDCRGAECIKGVCAPIVLATGVMATSFTDPVVSGGFLYWRNDHSRIERIGIDGGDRGVVINDDVGAFVAADGGVYWAQSVNDGTPRNGVFFTPEGGTAQKLAGEQYSPSAMALQGDTLYWADFFSESFGAGTIWSIPTGGGTPSAVLSAIVKVERMETGGVAALVVDGFREMEWRRPFLLSTAGQVQELPNATDVIWDLVANDRYAAWAGGSKVAVYDFKTQASYVSDYVSAKRVALAGDEVLAATSEGLESLVLPTLEREVLLPDVAISELVVDDGYVYLFADGKLLRWTR